MASDQGGAKRKASVRGLFVKTLQLGATLEEIKSSSAPEKKLYRSQSDQLEHGGEHGGSTTRRGRTTDRKGYSTDRGPKKTERSIRDMIVEIETRARGGLSSPRFAHDIGSLPPEFLDWHKGRRSPRRSASPKSPGRGEGHLSSRPVVNIIGCQQPTELILSRADDRIRRQLVAAEMRDIACTEQRNRILRMIADQETKAERMAENIKKQQLQSGWLKILQIAAFMAQYQPMAAVEIERLRTQRRSSLAGMKVAHMIVSWHQRKHAQRYLNMFRCVLASRSSLFLVRFRIIYKRQCVKRIRSFFSEIKDRTKVANLVHGFLGSVRLIQKAIRNFIACRLEKVRSTMIIWDRLELEYIKTKLTERKKKLLISKSRKVEQLAMDFTTRAEMERQMKKWDDANQKMERILAIHRRRGMLTDETAETEALQYVVPHHVKFRIVADLVKAMRREFMLSLDDIKKKASSQTSYSTSDATNFLQRKTKVYGQGMPELEGATIGKLDKGRSKASRMVLQFVFFKKMKTQNILDAIKAYHEDIGTFHLNTEGRKKKIEQAEGTADSTVDAATSRALRRASTVLRGDIPGVN